MFAKQSQMNSAMRLGIVAPLVMAGFVVGETEAEAAFIPNAITTATATAGANADGATYELQTVNGNGITVGNPLLASTWTHDNDWTHGWQMNYNNGTPSPQANNAWFTIDLGSVHNDLASAVIWNVRENTDRGTRAVNVFYGTAPTTGITDGQSVPTFNVSDGWTSLLSNHEIPQSPPGGTAPGNNSAQDDSLNLSGISARYISFQILSNWGGTSFARTGFSEIQVTTTPEPTAALLGLGMAGAASIKRRRRSC